MHKEGHIGAALLLYSSLGLFAVLLADSQLAFIGAVIAAGLAMLPDIDMRVPLFTHHEPTHTVGSLSPLALSSQFSVAMAAPIRLSQLPSVVLSSDICWEPEQVYLISRRMR